MFISPFAYGYVFISVEDPAIIHAELEAACTSVSGKW